MSKRMNRRWIGILGLLSFSTIIPLNLQPSIKEMARFTWFWPLIGGFIGICVGLFGFLVLGIIHLPQILASALIYSFAIVFTGLHHLDGLIDFGDGLMVQGDHQRKIEVMRDTLVGTGGISAFFIVAIITISAIVSTPANLILYVLFVSEISAKMGILTCCTFSRPLSDGTGRFFIESMDMKWLVLSFIITSLLGFLALNILGILGVIGGIAGGLSIAAIARRSFGGATGDVLGAANEVSRMMSLTLIIAGLLLWIFMC